MKWMQRTNTVIGLAAAMLGVLALTGCMEEEPRSDLPPQMPPQETVRHTVIETYGQIPREFQAIIEENRFDGIVAFEDRVLRAETLSEDGENHTALRQVRMMDLYGRDLAVYARETDDAYDIRTLTATEDGGFLFVLGFEDRARASGQWASAQGFASRVIKCDGSGRVQFDTPLDRIEGKALSHCFEVDGRYYFFGTVQTPAADRVGVYSVTDVSMILLDGDGQVACRASVGGSDFDRLSVAERTGDGFLLSVSAQSDDGDFAGSDSDGYPVDWVIRVNDRLEITEKKKGSGRSDFDDRLGIVNGKTVYRSDAIPTDFDAGAPYAILDYGDFDVVLSRNTTGVYEHTPPMISSIWYYWETVYSAYDKSGRLIFRGSVDSSPDYDAIVAEFGSAES